MACMTCIDSDVAFRESPPPRVPRRPRPREISRFLGARFPRPVLLPGRVADIFTGGNGPVRGERQYLRNCLTKGVLILWSTWGGGF